MDNSIRALTEEQRLIRESAKNFATSFLSRHSSHWAKTHTYPMEALKEMAKLGFLGMLVPESWHGSHLDTVAYVLVMEEIAAEDASTSTILGVQNGLINGALLNYGNDAQKELFLKPLAKGEKIGAFCLTESEAGSDAANIKTTAKKEGQFYVINGSKQFITSGKHADLALIFAKTDLTLGKKGISAFLVPTNLTGYKVSHIEEKMGQEAAVTVQLNFEDLKVPEDHLLGEENHGYKIALSQLESGRIGISAQCVGIARKALEHALSFAKERTTFGKKLKDHQAISFKLAEMATDIEAARSMTMHVAKLKDLNVPCVKEAAMAKLFASEMVERVCRSAIQIHGGYGYMCDYPVERLYRDARACSLYEGTSEIQKILISRALYE